MLATPVNARLIRLTAVARELGVHGATCYRWAFVGCRARNGVRVKLAVKRLGGIWYTTRADLDEFNAALQEHGNGHAEASLPRSARSPAARRKASEAAAKQLEKIGI